MFRSNIVGLAVGVVMSFVASTQACHQQVYTSQSQMDQDYAKELKACVDTSKTRAESEVCKRGVRWKYNVCQTPSGEFAPCQP